MMHLMRAFAATSVLAMTVSCSGSETPAGSAGTTGDGQSASSAPASGPLDACAMFTAAEIEKVVGNPVLRGEHYAGTQVCKWDTSDPGLVSVLLQTRPANGPHAQAMCPDLPKATDKGQRLDGVGDVAFWKFGGVGTLFNSGDLEMCFNKHYLNLSLNGKADEARLKQAALAIVRQVMQKM